MDWSNIIQLLKDPDLASWLQQCKHGQVAECLEPSLSYLDSVADGIYFSEALSKLKLLARINK